MIGEIAGSFAAYQAVEGTVIRYTGLEDASTTTEHEGDKAADAVKSDDTFIFEASPDSDGISGGLDRDIIRRVAPDHQNVSEEDPALDLTQEDSIVFLTDVEAPETDDGAGVLLALLLPAVSDDESAPGINGYADLSEAGAKSEDAFFVKVDSETMTSSDVAETDPGLSF